MSEDRFTLGAASAYGAPPIGEVYEADVVVRSLGPQQVKVIKLIRELTSLGNKPLSEVGLHVKMGWPVAVSLPPADAREMKAKLEGAGAVVQLKERTW